MKEILHRESIAYNELDEILDHADADPSHVAAGVTPIRSTQLQEGITLLAGNGKLGLYNADSRTLKIWNEQGMALNPEPFVPEMTQEEADALRTEAETLRKERDELVENTLKFDTIINAANEANASLDAELKRKTTDLDELTATHEALKSDHQSELFKLCALGNESTVENEKLKAHLEELENVGASEPEVKKGDEAPKKAGK